MSVGYICKLSKGIYELDISSGRYALVDFLPPTAVESLLLGVGSSANIVGGSLLGSKASSQTITFAVRVMGTSQAEVERGVGDVETFLSRAGDDMEPLYLDYLPNSYVPYKPVWGQGGWKRLEVVHGLMYRQAPYWVKDVRALAQIVTLELTIKPYALGLKQALAKGIGGVFEDYTGSSDGQYSGLYLPLAGTNLITNPVFGNPSAGDFDHDWTFVFVTPEQNTDPEYVFWGNNSFKAVCTGASGAVVMLITCANVNTHSVAIWVKKPDKSAVTAADCRGYYNAAGIASTYISIGDGWYIVQASFAGIVAAHAVGLEILADYGTIYVGGMCCQETATPITTMIHGDMLGCAWTGTAHDSTSTRTAAYLRLVDAQLFNTLVANGTIRVVIKHDANHEYANNYTLFTANTPGANLSGFYIAATDQFTLNDETVSAASAVQAYEVGDIQVIHFVWTQSILQIYVNGVAGVATASYDASTWATLYIGSSAAGTDQCPVKFQDFTMWDRAFTAAEALADYNNLAPLVADKQRISAIPYVWDKDGDGVMDCYNDATHSDLAVCGGITGDLQADTQLYIMNDGEDDGLLVANNPYFRYTGPLAGGINVLYSDEIGTAATAAEVGSAVRTSAGTTDTELEECYFDREAYAGRPFAIYMLAAYSAAGGPTISFAPRYSFVSGVYVTGEKKYFTFSQTYRRYLSPQIITPPSPMTKYPWLVQGNLYAGFLLTEETGHTTGENFG